MTRPRSLSDRDTAATASGPEALQGVRAVLERQRDFRREQLRGYESRGATAAGRASPDPAGEVDDLVAAGARRALEDIELALSRLATGRYGRCRVCGAEIPLAVLQAVPQTTACLSCLQPAGSSGRRGPAAASPERRP